MKTLTFYIVLLQMLLGSGQANAAKVAKNQVENVQKVSSQSGVWVIDNNQQPQRKPFVWVVEDTKKSAQQPFLQIIKNENKPGTLIKIVANDTKEGDLQEFDEVVKDAEKLEGLFTLYRNKETGKIYLEVKPNQLNKNYLSTVTLESGIGERGIYSGMPLQDFLFYFKRVNNNLHFVVRNVNYRTQPGEPEARSLSRSFSDSVLYSLKIKTIHPERQTILVDLGDLLLSDFPGLTSGLSWVLEAPFQLDEDKSYFGETKAFPKNMEIESVYGFTSSGNSDEGTSFVETIPDSRALTLRVRYSFSQLPENNSYHPRLADDRVGYFITAYQEFADNNRREPFVRYINRWHLEKQDPTAPLSRPKKPIVFWIENAVPVEYREAIKEGVLMWNKAFEAAGFKDAIEVRQMPDNATWDPADVRYNTIRWINTVDGYFAMGPSRVNPLTGEILDADIIVDASFVRSLRQQYRTLVEPNQGERSTLTAIIRDRNVCNNNLLRRTRSTQRRYNLSKLAIDYDLCYGMEAANQLAIGSLAMSFQNTMPSSDKNKEYIHQFVRLIVAHEIGHTLGLRHNFRGSTLLKPEEMNNTEITRVKGLTTSVMDYIPPNLAPQGVKQGDYFPTVVGPYDDWAIAYGYTPTGATNPVAERRFLEQIAQMSGKPELSYSPDEDMFDLDPTVNAWDNSGDVLLYSQWQLDNARAMWDRLNKRYPTKGESYSEVSEVFNTVFFHYLQNTYYATKYIGGQSFHRNHAGDRNYKLPFEPVPVEKQRQAIATLEKYIFAPDAFNFPPELLNKIAPSRWMHHGNYVEVGRLDYPIHDMVLAMQSMVLRDLLSGDRLSRLRDIELKSAPGQALTLPELFNSLQNSIWTEVIAGGNVKISSLRRGLQREHLETLTDMVLRNGYTTEDGRAIARYKLKQLRDKIDGTRSGDEYTKAHLMESRDRINKALNAQLESN